jgi:hypothetical protein
MLCVSCRNSNESVENVDADVIKQELNCSYFKTGTFTYEDAEYNGWYVMRNDTLSVEMNDLTREQIISKISWLNDCTYILKYESHANIDNEQVPKNDIKVTILSTYKDVYLCEVQDSMNNFRLSMKKTDVYKTN